VARIVDLDPAACCISKPQGLFLFCFFSFPSDLSSKHELGRCGAPRLAAQAGLVRGLFSLPCTFMSHLSLSPLLLTDPVSHPTEVAPAVLPALQDGQHLLTPCFNVNVTRVRLHHCVWSTSRTWHALVFRRLTAPCFSMDALMRDWYLRLHLEHVKPLDSTQASLPDTPNPILVLQGPQRSHEFEAPSLAEAHEWLDCLKSEVCFASLLPLHHTPQLLITSLHRVEFPQYPQVPVSHTELGRRSTQAISQQRAVPIPEPQSRRVTIAAPQGLSRGHVEVVDARRAQFPSVAPPPLQQMMPAHVGGMQPRPQARVSVPGASHIQVIMPASASEVRKSVGDGQPVQHTPIICVCRDLLVYAFIHHTQGCSKVPFMYGDISKEDAALLLKGQSGCFLFRASASKPP
jgi:hypothetical protein